MEESWKQQTNNNNNKLRNTTNALQQYAIKHQIELKLTLAIVIMCTLYTHLHVYKMIFSIYNMFYIELAH